MADASLSFAYSKSDGFTYSQSFFMTVASSTISSVCNITLITDFIWVDNFKEKGAPSRLPFSGCGADRP